MKKEITVIDPQKTLKQSNRLIEAKYKLTSQEQKLVIAICSQLDKTADNFDTVRIKVADFADFCQIKSTNRYAEVKRIIMRLLDRKLLIHKDDGGWYGTHWLQSAEYIPSESVIEYKIDERLRPELLQLKAAYLSTPAAPLMEFRRDYSARLYFILKKMLKVGEFEYDLDFFRERFMLSQSYVLFFNLKNKVLEPALAEINEKSDIDVVHEYIKQGRVYAKIKFKVALKGNTDKKALPAPEALEQALEPHTEPSEPIEKALEDLGQTKLFAMPSSQPPAPSTPHHEQDQDDEKKKRQLFWDNEILFSKLSRYFLNEQIEELIIKYGAERVESNLLYAEQHKQGKRNMIGWILSCVEQDHAGTAEAVEAVAKAEAEKQRAELMARLEPMPTPDVDPNDKRSVKERFADFKAKHKGGA